jgi:orotidine-5'-phosphate decarboxylase
MSQTQWQQLGHQDTIKDSVKKWAISAQSAGLDGVVCSAQEASMIKSVTSTDFLTVTPGIRPLNSSSDDQSRIMTPNKALENSSDFLVIGRPITQAENPAKTLASIYQQLPL